MASHQSTEQVDSILFASDAEPQQTPMRNLTDPVEYTDPFSFTQSQEIASNPRNAREAQEVVRQGAVIARETAQTNFNSLMGNLSYADFLSGLMMEGEEPLDRSLVVDYQHISITHYENGRKLADFVPGRMMITNKRILLVSCTTNRIQTLSEVGNPKVNLGGYCNRVVMEDSRVYFPIELEHFRTVHMSFEVGVISSVTTVGTDGCCPCFPLLSCCATSWWNGAPTVSSKDIRTLEMTLFIPPWKAPAVMIVAVSPSTPFHIMKRFVGAFQHEVWRHSMVKKQQTLFTSSDA